MEDQAEHSTHEVTVRHNDQASALGEEDRESGSVVERFSSIDRRSNGLCGIAEIRKQRLLDALSLYKLFTEADDVEQWITNKEKMLGTMVPGMEI